MATIIPVLAIVVLVSGCTRQYFHEGPAGDRYYQTAQGEILRVSRGGIVWKDSQQLGVAQKVTGESDWNLSAYQVVPPSGYCISALSDEIQPAHCWALLWQVPLQILASPFTAARDAYQEGNLSFVGPSSPPIPTIEERQRQSQ
jgi:hypothetical protein